MVNTDTAEVPAALDSEGFPPEPKRGRGRPLKKTADNPKGNPDLAPLPAPPRFDMEPGQFYRYWCGLSGKVPEGGTVSPRGRVLVYVYRKWPRIDVTQTLSPEEHEQFRLKKLKVSTNIGKLSEPPEDPARWEQELLHQFGSGDYHLKMTDTGRKKQIAMCTAVGLRDLNAYPPDLNPSAASPEEALKQLVVDDPVNRSYLNWRSLNNLRNPGQEPEIEPTEEKDEDVANSVVMEKLVDGILEQAKSREQAPPPPARPASDVPVERVVEVMTQANKETLSFVSEGIRRMNEASAAHADPLAIVGKIVDVAKSLQPSAAPADSGSSQLVKELIGLYKDQAERAERRMEALEARIAAPAAQPAAAAAPAPPAGATVNPAEPAKPKTLVEQLRELKETKEAFHELFGGAAAEVDEAVEDSKAASLLDKGLQAMPLVMQGLGLLATTIFNLTRKEGQPPIAPPAMPGMSGAPAPGAPAPVLNGPAVAANPMEAQAMQLIRIVEQPVLQALRTGQPGFQCAAELIRQHGQPALQGYQMAVSMGKDTLLLLISKYAPALWDVAQRNSGEVDAFLQEFLSAEDVNTLLQGGTGPHRVQGQRRTQ
ncbi:MAG: hypothetical protein U0Q18_25420 [Bryobacteraceae bacterium]